jgi:hypothetical protein
LRAYRDPEHVVDERRHAARGRVGSDALGGGGASRRVGVGACERARDLLEAVRADGMADGEPGAE